MKAAIELAKEQDMNESPIIDAIYGAEDQPKYDVQEMPVEKSDKVEPCYYKKCILPIKGSSIEFYRSSAEKLGELLMEVVDAEGPIHKSEAMRRVANAFGLQKVTYPLESHMNKAIDYLKNNSFISTEGKFLWPSDGREVKVRMPEEGKSPRSIRYIPPEEIILAINLCLKDCYSLEKDDLIHAVGKALGFKRISKSTSETISTVITDLINKNEISETNGIIMDNKE